MAAAIKQPKPFKIKGKHIVSFLGEAEWCKVLPRQMETKFTPRGQFSVNVVTEPTAADWHDFTAKISEMLDTALKEAMGDEGDMKIPPSKKKTLTVVYPWKDHVIKEKDDDGKYTIETETGKMVIQPKMKDVLDRQPGKNRVQIIGAGNIPIPIDEAPEIGNGSKIKVKMFVNPYYMPTTNQIGVSLGLEAIKVYELVEYSKGADGEDFDDLDGADLSGGSKHSADDSDELDF